MTFQDKLETIKDLLRKRDEIDAELEALIGAAPKPLSIRDKEIEASTHSARKVRVCSMCGKAGHTARKCSKKPVAKPSVEEPAELLTGSQFDEVKRLKAAGDLHTRDFASEHGLSLEEVNRAVFAKDYEDYAIGG